VQGTSQVHIYINMAEQEGASCMARWKDSYIVKVHYPEAKEDMLVIKRKMGAAYVQFVKDYILTLPISNKEKNRLYVKIAEQLLSAK